MAKLFIYIIIVIFGYAAISTFFSQRVTTPYYSVVLSDGWTLSQNVESKGNVVTASFLNKRTNTSVQVTVEPVSIATDIKNLISPLMQLGNNIFNPNMKMSDTKQGNGFTYMNYKGKEQQGVIFNSGNDKYQVYINVSGSEYGDGIDFVNSFFNTDKTLFPLYIDPNAPHNGFNYVYYLRKVKTLIHQYLIPASWFKSTTTTANG